MFVILDLKHILLEDRNESKITLLMKRSEKKGTEERIWQGKNVEKCMNKMKPRYTTPFS